MARTFRFLIAVAAGLVPVLMAPGCSSNSNEASMAGTKGVASSNAAKSQEEYFKQQTAQQQKKPGAADKSAKP